IRAISSFRREVGISTVSCSALFALRMRASMSAIGSVSIGASPAGLGHAGDLPLVRELAQADPAEAELAVDGARAAAPAAPAVAPDAEALRLLRLVDERLLGHLAFPPVVFTCERHAHGAQESQAVLVALRRRRDRHVQTPDGGDVVVVDLGEDDLLADPEREVAAPVERPRVEAAEVADPRQRDRNEPVEELVHPVAAQRDAGADRHPVANLETGDRLPRPANLGPLAGDGRQLLDRAVEGLGLGLRLADPHVERDLLDARNLHDGAQAQLVLQARANILVVRLLEARHVIRGSLCRGAHRSIAWPQSARRQTRTFSLRPLISRTPTPVRVGRRQAGQTTITFETSIGPDFSITPPGWICGAPIRLGLLIGRGRVCRLIMFRFSTTTRPSFGRASRTRPCLPRSLPLSTWTRSPFLIFIGLTAITGPPVPGKRSS